MKEGSTFFVESQKDILALLEKVTQLKNSANQYKLILSPHFAPAQDNAILQKISELADTVKNWVNLNEKIQNELIIDIGRISDYCGVFAEEYLTPIDTLKASIKTFVEYINYHVRNLFEHISESKGLIIIKNDIDGIFYNAETLEKELKKILEEMHLENKMAQKQHWMTQQELANKRLRREAQHYQDALLQRLKELLQKLNESMKEDLGSGETINLSHDLNEWSVQDFKSYFPEQIHSAFIQSLDNTGVKITQLNFVLRCSRLLRIQIHFDCVKDMFVFFFYYPNSPRQVSLIKQFLNPEDFIEQKELLLAILETIFRRD